MDTAPGLIIRLHPQSAQYADKPGAYSLLIESTSSHLNPGGIARLRVFISGYGYIRQPKLRIQPPSGAFVEEESTVKFDFNRVDTGSLEWGVTSRGLYEDGVTISLVGGVSLEGGEWDEPSFIIDAYSEDGTNMILTETSRNGKAPIELDIKTKEAVRPGRHSVTFVLTYFNGTTWVTDRASYDLVVLSWYERHQVPIWILGVVVTLNLFLISLFADHHGFVSEVCTSPNSPVIYSLISEPCH